MELLHNIDERTARLCEYLELLASGDSTREGHDKFDKLLATATPFEVNAALDAILSRTDKIDALRIPVSRFVRAVSKSLDGQDLPVYPEGHLLARFDEENDRIEENLNDLQEIVKTVRTGRLSIMELTSFVGGMTVLQHHYTALQNELFPLFEKAAPEHACVKLMWTIQSYVLVLQKKLSGEHQAPPPDAAYWKLLGDFFLNAGALLYRERRILFPVAFRALSIDRPSGSIMPAVSGLAPVFMAVTGSLAQNELEAIFKVLPVDISFIGADDRVKFYSDPPHRIFPRSPAVIGRLVQNCHPPKSVSTVEAILLSFKTGKSDSEEFYLTLQERFVHIQYFAVRGPENEYLGTLEVSQDATHVRALSGDKRLL
jgi:DUF438 domain-containing protein